VVARTRYSVTLYVRAYIAYIALLLLLVVVVVVVVVVLDSMHHKLNYEYDNKEQGIAPATKF